LSFIVGNIVLSHPTTWNQAQRLRSTGRTLAGATSDMKEIAGLNRDYRLIAGHSWVLEGGPWTLATIWGGP